MPEKRKSRTNTPKPEGRTRAYWVPTPEIINKIEALSARGLYQEDIARCIGIAPSVFSDKKITFPEIEEAIKKGAAKGAAVATNALFEKMEKGDTIAILFYLKCRCKWKEHSNEDTMSSFYAFMRDFILYLKVNEPKAVPVIENVFDDFMVHARSKYEIEYKPNTPSR